MKSLNTIRKIHKYKMDSLLKEVAIMEVELNANQNSLHELSELERSEIENFSASDFAFTLEKYIAYVNEKKQKYYSPTRRERAREEGRVFFKNSRLLPFLSHSSFPFLLHLFLLLASFSLLSRCC